MASTGKDPADVNVGFWVVILADKGWYILDWSFENGMELDSEFGFEFEISQGVCIVH